MLKGFDEDLAGIELPDEIKAQVLDFANKRTEGLINKNSELLEKVTNKEVLSASEKAKLAELESFKTQAEIKASEDAQNWQETKKLISEGYEKQLLEVSEKLSNYEKEISTYKIDNALMKELDGVNINPALKDTVFKAMKADAIIADGQAMISEKPLSEYVNEWSQTDTGKAFCLAAENSNGSGNGGNQSVGNKTKAYGDMSVSEKAAYLKNKQ